MQLLSGERAAIESVSNRSSPGAFRRLRARLIRPLGGRGAVGFVLSHGQVVVCAQHAAHRDMCIHS